MQNQTSYKMQNQTRIITLTSIVLEMNMFFFVKWFSI